MKNYFKYIWRVVTTPSCWLRNWKTSKDWDRLLNCLLDYHIPQECAEPHPYTIKLGSYEIWIANKFYCYGYEWSGKIVGPYYLPSRKTCFRLYDAARKAGLQ